MGPLYVVEVDPHADDPSGMKAVDQFVQIDCLLFEQARAPEPLKEHVVYAAPAAVHGDHHAGSLEYARKIEVGVLIPLVRVEDLRPAVLRQRPGPGPQRRTR